MTIVLNGTTGITSTGITETSDGNVGIGTSSPNGKLHVAGGASNVNLYLSNDSYSSYYYQNTGGSSGVDYPASQAYIWSQGGSERARIDSSGNLLVGCTSAVSASVQGFQVNSSGQVNTSLLTTSSVIHYRFYNPNGVVGTITTSGSSTAYNTSSDYRLKEDWVAVANASTRVNALKPVNFAWKASGTRVDGFLAHELAEVVPEAVTGEKDAVELVDIKDEDGNVTGQEERPVYQGIDQSKLVPLLTAALQEALAEIETLKARVSALEAA